VREVGAPQPALRSRLEQRAGERDRVVERFAREGISYRSFGRRSANLAYANDREGSMTRIIRAPG
jgi:hypothetical protein